MDKTPKKPKKKIIKKDEQVDKSQAPTNPDRASTSKEKNKQRMPNKTPQTWSLTEIAWGRK